MIFSLYYLARKFRGLLHRVHDWILYIGIGLILWPVLNVSAGFEGLKHALAHMEFETWAGVVVVVLSSLLRLTIWICLRRWESAPLAASDQAKSTSSTLAVRGVQTKDDVEKLAEFASSVFPQGPFSTRDIRDKHHTYARWHLAVPGFAKLIHTKVEPQTIVGFSIILPLKREIYIRYRTADAEPWSWGPEAIDDARGGNEVFLYFQAIYCYPVHGKGEAGFLTHLVIEHVKELSQGKKTVIIAPRKSASGQANLRRLGFEGVRNSYTGFPLFELDARRLAELSPEAAAFGGKLISPKAGSKIP